LADEQENMIDKYLPNGDLFALYDDDLKSICVVVPINHPLFDGDIQLIDMIYLKKDLWRIY